MNNKDRLSLAFGEEIKPTSFLLELDFFYYFDTDIKNIVRSEIYKKGIADWIDSDWDMIVCDKEKCYVKEPFLGWADIDQDFLLRHTYGTWYLTGDSLIYYVAAFINSFDGLQNHDLSFNFICNFSKWLDAISPFYAGSKKIRVRKNLTEKLNVFSPAQKNEIALFLKNIYELEDANSSDEFIEMAKKIRSMYELYWKYFLM